MLRMVISHIIPVSIVAFEVYESSFRYTKEVALGEMHHRGYRLNTDNYYIIQLLFIWHIFFAVITSIMYCVWRNSPLQCQNEDTHQHESIINIIAIASCCTSDLLRN